MVARLRDDHAPCSSTLTRSPCFSPAFSPPTGCCGSWPRLQNVLLLGAGYYFYACWNARLLALLVLSTVMDYACGLWVDHVENQGKRRAVVGLSMALNLGMLGYFKYYNFFVESCARGAEHGQAFRFLCVTWSWYCRSASRFTRFSR